MVEGNLDTTNLLLGIMAAVGVLEAVVLIAVAVMAWKLYGRTLQTVREIEERQIEPLRAKVDAMIVTVDGILVDVKRVTASVGAQTERVNSAISTTIDRVDETADRVRHSMAFRLNRVLSVVHGARAALGQLVNGHSRTTASAP